LEMANQDEDVTGDRRIVVILSGVELGKSLIRRLVGDGDEEFDVAGQPRPVDERQPCGQRDGDEHEQDKQVTPAGAPPWPCEDATLRR
jgi:hypothetical protein